MNAVLGFQISHAWEKKLEIVSLMLLMGFFRPLTSRRISAHSHLLAIGETIGVLTQVS